MKLTSIAFQDHSSIPTKYAHEGIPGGLNISPPVAWTEIPTDTKSFALSVIDPHPVANHWVHWLVVNIPSATMMLPEGASQTRMPSGSKELYNSFGEVGYGGPEPPKGSGRHPYEFVLYALDVPALDLSANTTRVGFLNEVAKHTIATAKLTGSFER